MRVNCAVQILRQKRMYETQRETLYNQQFNMEQTRFTVESIQVCGSAASSAYCPVQGHRKLTSNTPAPAICSTTGAYIESFGLHAADAIIIIKNGGVCYMYISFGNVESTPQQLQHVCYDASTLAACYAVASSITHAFCHCRT
jgi:hypothetical protein